MFRTYHSSHKANEKYRSSHQGNEKYTAVINDKMNWFKFKQYNYKDDVHIDSEVEEIAITNWLRQTMLVQVGK